MYYRKYKTRRKTTDNSPANERLMHSHRKESLHRLRSKYGELPLIQHKEGFGLTDEIIKDIDTYNKEIARRNSLSWQRTNEANRKKKIFVGLLMTMPFLLATVLIFKFLGSLTFSVFIIFPLIFFFFLATDKVAEIFYTVAKNEAFHKLTNNLNLFRQAEEDRRLFVELINEEKIDLSERQKREFWFSLTGFEFEYQMTKLFSELGFNAKKTKNTGDGGVDIILVKDRDTIVVQCKAHKKPIGPHEVRDLYGAMHDRRAQKAMLINLGGFTSGVKDFCKGKSITLMDINDILALQERATIQTVKIL